MEVSIWAIALVSVSLVGCAGGPPGRDQDAAGSRDLSSVALPDRSLAVPPVAVPAVPAAIPAAPVAPVAPPVAPVAAPGKQTPAATSRPRTAAPTIDVTRFTDYLDDDYPEAISVPFKDAYTRLIVEGRVYERDAEGDRRAVQSKGYETRPWLNRYLVGLKENINLSVQIRVGSYEETVSLVTLSSSSDRNGSSWDRDVTHEAFDFPWFHVSNDTSAPTPQAILQFRGSRTIESGSASAALQAALAGIKAVSPQASVVTKLSEPGTRERAAAIDQVISKLFSSRVGETHRSDRSIAAWQDSRALRLILRIPKDTADWDGDLHEVGTWRLRFAAPRPSLFSSAQVCGHRNLANCEVDDTAAIKVALDGKDAGTILAFPLIRSSAGDVTVKSHILQQAWYASALNTFSGVQKDDIETANTLCLSVRDTMRSLGLNKLDSALATWAVTTGLPRARAMHTQAWSASSCNEILRPIR